MTTKNCMLSYCNGRLNKNFQCLKCENNFCKSCEKLKKDSHVCNKDDIESLKFINDNLVRCPNCNFPIQRSQGCDGMTCAHCKTNFDYSSGEKSAYGNHGQNKPIDIKDEFKLSNLYKDNYDEDIINQLIKIESKKPTIVKIDKLLETLSKIDNQNYNDFKTELIKQFEKFMLSKYNYKKYINTISTIESIHIDENRMLSEMYLETLYDEL